MDSIEGYGKSMGW